ncbi:MAG: IclR family transcriptional regulator [Proteobacteria bacterium]|nr:IclR family transcriptional regulator [Pseudomonadota bacterium]
MKTDPSDSIADKPAPEDDGSNPENNNRVGNSVMVKPIINAIRILRHLTETGTPERAADLARLLSINPSTCFNILRTLVAEDIVDFDRRAKTYTAGLGLAKLVGNMVTEGQRLEAARPLMQEFAARFGVTVTLWRRMGTDRIVLVNSETSPADLRIDMATGQRLPMLMGASGRLFASRLDLDDPELRAVFDKIRWARPLSFETYLQEVEQCRQQGWSLDDGYFSAGIMVIAAPVCDRNDNIAYTVSAVMFRGQYDEAGIETVGREIKELGQKLAAMLF